MNKIYNNGKVSDNLKNHILQAYSHWTYHITNGQLIHTHVQGWERNNERILTDPAILSNTKEYGATDLGKKGIINFMKLHEVINIVITNGLNHI